MDRVHSVWECPSGDCLEKSGATFPASLHKELDHWEMSAFVHQTKVLREDTSCDVLFQDKHILLQLLETLPMNCHFAFVGHTSVMTYSW